MNRATKRERLRRVRMWSRRVVFWRRWLDQFVARPPAFSSERWEDYYQWEHWAHRADKKRRKAWRYGENFIDWHYATWWSRAPKRFLEVKR